MGFSGEGGGLNRVARFQKGVWVLVGWKTSTESPISLLAIATVAFAKAGHTRC